MMKYTYHTFMPGHTIDAVLRLKNRHDMKKDELIPLREMFNLLNDGKLPRVGDTFKIPVQEELMERTQNTGIS